MTPALPMPHKPTLGGWERWPWQEGSTGTKQVHGGGGGLEGLQARSSLKSFRKARQQMTSCLGLKGQPGGDHQAVQGRAHQTELAHPRKQGSQRYRGKRQGPPGD